ncbi:Lipid II:glycine glycyltransferase (Peptidoglycan interpeptide bridge formation enzyme) [Rhodococcus tukisamuensis]|uniref:Lipid II:glycine glycyltransferase (Peptidoglycan interpeptide bridge formation enzyme) n=2 Tax=Rhodococcus tukisamuensis TaxID=168276 RepID=A0A1G6YBS3_9NOCA|nr:Lipid II:glycine glycyltransferase (Peptidoglycan interpeptide bridge formation enzyme) [Rhodococcus tukisamuensis]
MADPSEVEGWDDLIVANPDGGDVWRSRDYAEQKRFNGYHPVHLMVDGLAVTVLEKRVVALGKLWYLPGGPGVVGVDGVISVVDLLAEFARAHGVFAVKIEPKIRFGDVERGQLLARGFRQARSIAANSSTIVLDISGEPTEVMSRFSTRARRWIRRAERDGVRVDRVPATPANCRLVFDLLSDTAKGRFGIRSYEYYEEFWGRYESSGNGQLFVARFEGEVMAGGFAMKLGRNAYYMNGASVRKREDSSAQSGLGAHGVGHAVQWAMIEWARESGCVRYDMGGTPPAAFADDKAHPFHGIGQFKQSFSYDIVDYLGAYDLPLSRARYALWQKVLEREARRFTMIVRKDYYW